jgi:glycosyltransferase involved in cell wall biosynthesis
MNPLISVVLPTYNGARYLRQSITSCLTQTHQNLELIIVDDHSSDDTPLIIRSFQDSRIHYIRNDINQRLPSALNIGFAQAKGDYLTWTSDDNFYLPEALEKMLLTLLSRQGDFVYCAYFSIHDDQKRDDRQIVRLPEDASFKDVNFVRACFMYSRRVMEQIGCYDPEVELSEDYDYWIRVSKKFKLHYLNEPLYCYRYHNNALFSKRYWEQEVVKCLVRYRHGLFSQEEALKYLIQLYARQRSKRPLRPFVRCWAGLVLNRALSELLEISQDGLASFTHLKDNIFRKVLI